MNIINFHESLKKAEGAINSLTAQGVDILSVIVRQSQPVIRITRSDYCEKLVRSGRAAYVTYNGDDIEHGGRLCHQGQFIESGCRVWWSESLM